MLGSLSARLVGGLGRQERGPAGHAPNLRKSLYEVNAASGSLPPGANPPSCVVADEFADGDPGVLPSSGCTSPASTIWKLGYRVPGENRHGRERLAAAPRDLVHGRARLTADTAARAW